MFGASEDEIKEKSYLFYGLVFISSFVNTAYGIKIFLVVFGSILENELMECI